jgi:hypothetical protein
MAVVVHGVSLSVTLVVHPVHLEDVSSGALAALVAVDFFTTEVWTARGLVTYYGVPVRRRIQVIGCTPYPTKPLSSNVAPRHQ